MLPGNHSLSVNQSRLNGPENVFGLAEDETAPTNQPQRFMTRYQPYILNYTSRSPVPTFNISPELCNIPTQKPLLGQENSLEDFLTQKHRVDDGRHGPLRAGAHNASERLYYLVCLSGAYHPLDEEPNVVVTLDISIPYIMYSQMQAVRIALPDLLAFLENFKNSYPDHPEAKEATWFLENILSKMDSLKSRGLIVSR